MKELTKAEEQIMQVLWAMEKAFVKDIIEKLPDPKPAYNTVSTIVRILETKGFVGHKSYGKSHQYHPLIEKPDYTSAMMKGVVRNYFSNSLKQLVSFFADDKDISVNELQEIREMLDKKIDNQKK